MDENGFITIKDLPKEAYEELKEILKQDVLRSYRAGELICEEEEVRKGLTDEEVLKEYNNETCWDEEVINEYLTAWQGRG